MRGTHQSHTTCRICLVTKDNQISFLHFANLSKNTSCKRRVKIRTNGSRICNHSTRGLYYKTFFGSSEKICRMFRKNLLDVLKKICRMFRKKNSVKFHYKTWRKKILRLRQNLPLLFCFGRSDKFVGKKSFIVLTPGSYPLNIGKTNNRIKSNPKTLISFYI